ncbi:MAG: hypothetical protein WC323_03070 [Patescibacteria group bacterium]|jgi:hypothetical protein
MSKIQELLQGRNEKINYNKIIEQYPWIVEKNLNCILSPDSDGLLCGLLMSNFLNWKIRGFYDGKIMLLKEGISPKDCVFLDMEIYRENIRSVGHHMLLLNKNIKPDGWDNNFKNCIQPNNMRGYDGKHDFRLKYPLATIHLLIGILNEFNKITLTENAIPPLYFTDGTFNVLFKYPENVLNWLGYLKVDEKDNPLNTIFENEKYTSVINLIKEMDLFFRRRDEINAPRERGDRLKISTKDGELYNIKKTGDTYKIINEAVDRIVLFLKILEEGMIWEYKKNLWTWENLKLFKFTKRDFKKDNKTLTIPNFNEFMGKQPLSWAMTSGLNIEYTLETPDKL